MLIDTQILVWTIWEKWSRFGPITRQLLKEKEFEVILSTASLMEIELKQRRGKLQGHSVKQILHKINQGGLRILDITPGNVISIPGLDITPHADPFDLLLVGQAINEGLSLLTTDAEILKINLPGLKLIDGRR